MLCSICFPLIAELGYINWMVWMLSWSLVVSRINFPPLVSFATFLMMPYLCIHIHINKVTNPTRSRMNKNPKPYIIILIP